jgi:menaquinol-cytochrome c reductase iron-sulfur subunit
MVDRGCKTPEEAPLEQRRGFLATLVAIIAGSVALLMPAAVGIVAFFSPLRQKRQAEGFVRVTNFDALPEDGTPQKYPIVADRIDAWNFFPSVPVGAVYLRRAGADKVEALQVVCPHAGCAIGLETAGDGPHSDHRGAAVPALPKGEGTSKAGPKFFCPCHAASFDLMGKRLDADSPSPRDMDALAAEIRDNGEVWVKFQNFATGIAAKVVQS